MHELCSIIPLGFVPSRNVEELAEVQALLCRGERCRVTKNVVRVLFRALFLRYRLLPLPAFLDVG